MRISPACCSVLLWLVASAAVGGAGEVDYLRDVKPIFQARCLACHGAVKQESGLRLDTGRLAIGGGDSGAAIQPGRPGESLLLARVSASDAAERMPPEGKPLTAEQLRLLRLWVEQGAPSPDDEEPQADPRAHWAFRPPPRPAVPRLAGDRQAWIRNPIDAFIAAGHQQRGLAPLPPAGKHVLLRRVYLDLIGLPPTRPQLLAFLADEAPDAYEKVVDQLLDSPHYGQRWGRHWMDVWRYSDWYGRRQVDDVRNSYPHIWRWRDWIIDSLNRDKGYDQMVREMLAADELYPEDDARIAALGFIVRNWFSLNYDTWKQDLVEHTGKAFLGLRLNCAHCHDHKYDPISQEEYFRFRAFFEPLELRHDRVPGGPPLVKYLRYKPGSGSSLKPIEAGLPRVYDHELEAETHMYRLGDTRNRFDRPPVTPAAPAVLGGDTLHVETVSLPAVAWYPGLKPFAQQAELQQRAAAVAVAAQALETAQGAAAAQPTSAASSAEAPPPAAANQQACQAAEANLEHARAELAAITARIAADNARYGADGRDADALARQAALAEHQARLAARRNELAQAEKRLGDQQRAEHPDAKKVMQAQQQAAAARTALDKLDKENVTPGTAYTPLGPQYPQTSSGRRRALARWIASPDNPLTARVAVNHIWMRHFGRPLVASVFDFGLGGKPPTHPQLLDWLAVELMQGAGRGEQGAEPLAECEEGGWSMKHLHRLIVTSSTYRQSSRPGGSDHPNFAVDKDNVYWWKFDRRRLEGELVRDCLLHVAGQLDARLGGPEIDPGQESASRRRSLYFAIYPEAGGMMRFLSVFDPPNPGDCYRRTESIVPQQALALANSALALNQGRLLAADLSARMVEGESEAGGEPQFIVAAFERILSRPPTPAEQEACGEFLERQRVLYGETAEPQLRAAAPQGVVAAARDPQRRARESLLRVLLNHNDFVTIH